MMIYTVFSSKFQKTSIFLVIISIISISLPYVDREHGCDAGARRELRAEQDQMHLAPGLNVGQGRVDLLIVYYFTTSTQLLVFR